MGTLALCVAKVNSIAISVSKPGNCYPELYVLAINEDGYIVWERDVRAFLFS